MNNQNNNRQASIFGMSIFRLTNTPVYVALLLPLSLIVYGGTSDMSQNQSGQQLEVNTELLEMLAKWQTVRTPGKGHELLGKLAGEWDITLRFHGRKQSWESKCTSQCTLLHGGRFLLEQITGEIYAPDEKGHMRLEPYTATRFLGYDNYKKAYVGAFAENQNTYFLTFQGHEKPGGSDQIPMFGLSDEPMLEIQDATMKYVLSLKNNDHYVWEVYALAVDDNYKVFDFVYTRRNAER
ncbi:MAG: DUF1579 domain-containing protein [FCB group bacterium]|nr:DUF1579 domain-containing protein [FCB group bacterium]